MILKALADYYQRLADDPRVDIAPPGFERKAINFLIELNSNGSFAGLRDIRVGTGRTRKGRVSLVPKSVKRAANILANLLWDNPSYIFGINKAKPERGIKQREAFIERIEQALEGCTDDGIQAVLSFLKKADFSAVFNHALWNDVEESGGNISFVLSGETQLVCQRSDVVAAILESAKPEGGTQTCVVSGKDDVPSKLHTAIKGVWGAQTAGANIVSFNLDAFRSFGKKQGYNAPVGQQVEFAYTTALNYLLASENQRMQVGDASTVFWAKDPCDFENDFVSYLAPKKGEEAVSYEKIRGLLNAVRSGVPPQEADLPFYVLGLAPNASRIAIRFWYDGNLKEIKERMAEHYTDIEIQPGRDDLPHPALHRLLLSIVPTKESERSKKIPPNLSGEVMQAVLTGTVYPRTLFANAIRRCKAEQRVNFIRASIIKGFLVRDARINKRNHKEVSVGLDKTYDNVGYVLGRLFFYLERIQELAQGRGLNKTIRDTYFGAAASSPLVTFKRLGDLSTQHLAKARNSGDDKTKALANWLDKQKSEVMALLDPQVGFPPLLSLEDQGRFSIGYYHQRQDFFTKKESTEDKGEEQ